MLQYNYIESNSFVLALRNYAGQFVLMAKSNKLKLKKKKRTIKENENK